MTEENWKIVGGFRRSATKRGHTLLELAFSWLLSRPVLSSVIAGATRPEQVEQNVKAADWKLTAGRSWRKIDRITKEGLRSIPPGAARGRVSVAAPVADALARDCRDRCRSPA